MAGSNALEAFLVIRSSLNTVNFLLKFQARTDMEQQTIEGASTSDAVGFITIVQSLKRKLKNWEKNVEV